MKTIRFKLTFWYSVVLFCFALGFVISLNIIVGQYYLSEPPPAIFIQNTNTGSIPAHWIDLAQEERDQISEVRKADLDLIRRVSFLSLIPLAILSFLGGYFLTSQFLRPLSDINKATKKINAENLQIKIKDTGVDDELGELITNFNQMVERIEHAFGLQKQFIESASHELKTPLAIIQTNLDTILTDPKATKEELRESISIALKSVKYMNKLAEDLLLLSFQSAHLQLEPVNVVKLLQEIVANLQLLATEHETEIQLSNQVQKEEFQVIKANKFYISRALANLIENAIKYSSPGKENKVTVIISHTNQYLKIEIIDRGVGIPAVDLDLIFHRFYRVDKSRSRSQGGIGLGLSITKKIIEEHGGKISVESEVGRGSKFTLQLPIAQ